MHANTTAYLARLASFDGHVIPAEGIAAVDGLFELNDAESVTLQEGWLFGSKVNLPAGSGRQLNLVTTNDWVHQDVDDSILHIGAGAICLEGDTDSKGYLSCGTQLLSNNDWTMLCFFNKATRNSTATAPDENSYGLSQYNSFANGHCYISLAYNLGLSLTVLGATTQSITLRTSGLGEVGPLAVWLTYTHSTRQLSAYDAYTGTQLGSTITAADLGGGNSFVALNTRIGQYQRGLSAPPRLQQHLGYFKFAGVMDETKRDSLFGLDRTSPSSPEVIEGGYLWAMTEFNTQLVVWGTSVTDGSDAISQTKNSDAWRHKFNVEMIKHNVVMWSPGSMGGKDLYYYRHANYAHPPGRASVLGTMVARDTNAAVEQYMYRRINMVICDDQQNFCAGVGVDPGGSVDMLYTDYTDVLFTGMVDHLRTKRDVDVVCGTMLALAAWATGTMDPLTYSQVAALAHRQNLRTFSAGVRADPKYAAVYDMYADFNLGWDVSDDGDAPNPITDLPNGNPAYFYDDPQHPGSAGHAVIAAGYIAAVQEALSGSPPFVGRINLISGLRSGFGRQLIRG